jgi:hypothetical protein
MGVQDIGRTPKEMDFGASEEQERDNNLALHGTPKMAAGLSGDLNRANIWGAEYVWCSNTIMPMHSMLAGFMTEKLAKRYAENLLVWFDPCLPHDAEEERKEQELDFSMGAMTPADRANYRDKETPTEPAATKRFLKAGFSPLEDFNDGTEERLSVTMPTGNEQEPNDDDEEEESPEGDNPGAGSSGGGNDGSTTSDFVHADGCPHAIRLVNSLGRPIQLNAKQRRTVAAWRRVHSQFERAMIPDLKRFWRGQKQTVMKALREADTWDKIKSLRVHELFPQKAFAQQFNSATQRHWRSQLAAGAVFEAEVSGVSLEKESQATPPSIEVDLPDSVKLEMEQFLQRQSVSVWQNYYAGTYTALQAALQEGVTAGVGISDVASRVSSVLDSSVASSTRIARTNATGMLNSGQQMLRTHAGIQKKEWMATTDGRTRATHTMANATIVPNGQAFTVGGYQLMFPGDYSLGADASEVENCRCTSAGSVD